MATALRPTPNQVNPARAAALFHALSDPIRLNVVRLLTDGERCVCELMEELDMAQSRLSWHLKTLADAGVITSRREGRWNYYSLNHDALNEGRDILATFKPNRRPAVRMAGCCD